jgi:hypothetical protein
MTKEKGFEFMEYILITKYIIFKILNFIFKCEKRYE